MCYTSEFPRKADEAHAEFIGKVRKQYQTFGLPYMGLFKEGHYLVPHIGPIRGGTNGPARSLGAEKLAAEIERYAVGDGTIRMGKVIPITAVVEFSQAELYPEAMEILGRKYELKRISVD